MRQILPGVWTWSVYNEERGMDFNGHLVSNENGCVLVDPPPMTPEDLAQAGSLSPEAIVITNRHHTRDAITPAGRWRIRILLPEQDAPEIPHGVRLGGVYQDGERLPAGLLAVTLADQKTPGETALVCESAGAVILGDALIGHPPGRLGLLPADKYADPGRARAGIRKLLDHRFDAVLVGDGQSILQGGRRAIEEFLAGR